MSSLQPVYQSPFPKCYWHDPLPHDSSVVSPSCELLTKIATLIETYCAWGDGEEYTMYTYYVYHHSTKLYQKIRCRLYCYEYGARVTIPTARNK